MPSDRGSGLCGEEAGRRSVCWRHGRPFQRPGHTGRRNAPRECHGNMVAIEEFKGRFVWADYAAPWCRPCISQAQAIKEVEKSLGEGVVFLTVMTSATEEYASIPDQHTAKAWANRFGLNPEWRRQTCGRGQSRHTSSIPRKDKPSIVLRVICPQIKSTTFRVTCRIGTNGRETDAGNG